ncbi:neuronal acetylcholine receptor subunit alpha-3-like [Mytilus galloprovincialis]|uniref:neuronal acetylcholine receptor subunit alpha-3-like n=1 Tax=Mytilus galloprovincialis TaxID=29158 RepID=UPI003F7C26CE
MLPGVLQLLFLFGSVISQSNINVQKLYTFLFTTHNYNTLIRPSRNQSVPLSVHVIFTLYGISGVDEIEQKLIATGWLDVEWTDELLSWTPSSFGGLKYIYYPQGKVWKPDISLQNGFSKLEELGSKFISVFIDLNGLVNWRPFQVFESKCDIDSTYFPFDRQTCHLDFVAWSLSNADVHITKGGKGIQLAKDLQRHGEWKILSSSAMNLVIQRKPLYAIINYIMPILLLSILDIFTFKIPVDTGERMGCVITVWLAYAVFLTIISDSLPQTSESIPNVSIYIMIQIFIATVIVIISAIESGFTHLSDDASVYYLLNKLAKKFRKPSIQSESKCWDRAETCVTWKEAISALDKCLFWVCLTIFVLSTLITLLIASLQFI